MRNSTSRSSQITFAFMGVGMADLKPLTAAAASLT